MSTGWETPLDNVDPNNLDTFERVLPGRYHVQVKGMQFDAKNQMVVDLEVLNGTNQSEIGKSHREYFSPSENSRKRCLQFAIAAGVTSVEELDTLKRQGRPFTGWNNVTGKFLLVEIEEDTYQGKTKSKIGFGLWAIGDPKAKDIPLNNGVMAQSGNDPFDSNGSDDDPFATTP